MLCIFVSAGISQVHATRHLTWKQVTDHAVNIVKKAAHKILFHVTNGPKRAAHLRAGEK